MKKRLFAFARNDKPTVSLLGERSPRSNLVGQTFLSGILRSAGKNACPTRDCPPRRVSFACARNDKRTRGFTLVECLIYIAVMAIILNTLGPMFREALRASTTAREAVNVVSEAEVFLDAIRSDLRQAASVELPKEHGLPQEVRLLVRFNDKTGAAYVLREARLMRYGLPEGASFSQGEVQEGWPRRAFSGEFERLEVTAVKGANRVYRVDLSLRLNVPFLRGRDPEKHFANFTTAVRMKSEPVQ